MSYRNSRYDFDKNFLNSIRELNKKSLLREAEEEEKKDAIAITDDPKFGDHVLSNQIDNFRQTVNGSAKFASPNPEDPQSNPLVYFPSTGNLVFTGSIPTLSDLKFQFSLNDVTSSPYIFVDGLALTEEVITTLNRLRGYYLNWRDEWFTSTDLLSSIK
jgi:hypothetical protein